MDILAMGDLLYRSSKVVKVQLNTHGATVKVDHVPFCIGQLEVDCFERGVVHREKLVGTACGLPVAEVAITHVNWNTGHYITVTCPRA